MGCAAIALFLEMLRIFHHRVFRIYLFLIVTDYSTLVLFRFANKKIVAGTIDDLGECVVYCSLGSSHCHSDYSEFDHLFP
jgi:hypothetical protein